MFWPSFCLLAELLTKLWVDVREILEYLDYGPEQS